MSLERFDDKFFIGSTHEGAEGMFQKPEGKKTEVDLHQQWKERGIFENVEARFEKLLSDHSWEQVREIAPGLTYPTIKEWINHRIEFSRGTKFFPCFIKDQTGSISFLKVQIKAEEESLNGLVFEGKILEEQSIQTLEGDVPKFLGTSTPEDALAFVQTEAVPFNEGRVAPEKEWLPEHALNMAKIIRKLEDIKLSGFSERVTQDQRFTREVKATERIRDLLSRGKAYISDDVRAQVTALLEQGELPEVFVHGDVTGKNIIIKRGGKTMLVDWELAGKGFLAQDAGKFISGFDRDSERRKIFLEYYLNTNGRRDTERARALCLGIIAENLVHLVWRVENVLGTSQETPEVLAKTLKHKEKIENILADYKAW